MSDVSSVIRTVSDGGSFVLLAAFLLGFAWKVAPFLATLLTEFVNVQREIRDVLGEHAATRERQHGETRVSLNAVASELSAHVDRSLAEHEARLLRALRRDEEEPITARSANRRSRPGKGREA